MSPRVTAAALVLSMLGGWLALSSYSVAQNEGNDPAPKLEPPAAADGFKFSLLDDAGKLRGRGEYRTAAGDKVDVSMPGMDSQYNLANESLSLTLHKKMFIDLRSTTGELSKHIEARANGSTVTNAFTKGSDRLYEVIDEYDGSATINVYLNDQVKHTIKIEANGALSLKSNAEPPKETAAIGNAQPPVNP